MSPLARGTFGVRIRRSVATRRPDPRPIVWRWPGGVTLRLRSYLVMAGWR